MKADAVFAPHQLFLVLHILRDGWVMHFCTCLLRFIKVFG